ncbi:RNA polymerase II holoenzyme cyclin-like subunit [Tulasnella sp. 330]|nr:RNA polymerase II holoenzyme cyclin-like subunit [Tulasnella sp. 330]KAG8886484.1 RNA polymerase II holoenzyme cyclin-like subunit [Tulasnella sp. 331]KAG8891115.1 RNA polymerase II holoenzyme cyclin-like subunit [Tulasnella sp. 332]
MATNFWESSHQSNWLFDDATLKQARTLDMAYADTRELALIGIFFANVIAKLGKRLNLRQQVIATATVYFRRFYLKSSYCETDPFFVAATCCYVAAKAEEMPVHLKVVVTEARSVFSGYGIKTFPTDNTKLAEMEFYLLEDLEFHLVIFHPYRSLAAVAGRFAITDSAEAGEVGAEPDEERYWGSGEGRMDFENGCVQMAWFVINDSYRSDICLLYPPYLIAVAALYLSVLLHGNTRAKLSETLEEDPTSQISRRTRASTAAANTAGAPMSGQPGQVREQILDFLAGLNVSLETVGVICQRMLSMYALWDQLSDGSEADQKRRHERRLPGTATGIMPHGDVRVVYTEKDLVEKLLSMRERRESDLSHPPENPPDNRGYLERL